MEGVQPEIVDQTRLLSEVSFSFAGELREYQQKAVSAYLTRRSNVLEAGTPAKLLWHWRPLQQENSLHW
jgi:hypothetical protein